MADKSIKNITTSKGKEAKNFDIRSFGKMLYEELIAKPWYLLVHPFDGYDELKREKKISPLYVIVSLILLLLVNVYRQTGQGMLAYGMHIENPTVSLWFQALYTFAPILLFAVGNWCITSITDGKGKLYEIISVYLYASWAYIILMTLGVFLSNYITLNEIQFIRFLYVFGDIIRYGYLFVALIVIHEYTFSKAIVMVILTILAMLILVGVAALFLSLLGQFISFVVTVYNELQVHL